MSRYVETTLSCCVCGARAARAWRVAADHLLGGAQRFRAVRCARCGTARLDPRPPAGEMDRYYTPTTYARAEEEDASELAARLDEYNRRLAERAEAPMTAPVPRRALDVGCGDGRFLLALKRRGWEVEGLETEAAAAALARRRIEGTVYETPLETANLPAGRYGLVSLLHVIEHVSDPRETLMQAYRLLAPGGVLLLALPNAGSVEAKLFRSVWYPLDLPRHFWGFTPHTLTRLTEECGFRIVGLRYFPFLFAPQSLRYGLRAVGGRPVAPPGTADSAPKAERGRLRTRVFLALLTASERLGRTLPGEVMELTALRPAS